MSKEEIDKLILENRPLIYMAIKNMHCVYKTEDEFQELYDSGLLGLINGAKAYDNDTTKGKVSSWLYKCIRNEIGHYFMTKTRRKRYNEFGKDLSLYEKRYMNDQSELEIIDMIEDTSINLENDLENKLEIERLMYAINKVLSAKDRQILCQKYGLNGYRVHSHQELVEQEKVSKRMIGHRLIRAKKKLKEYLEKNDKEVFMIEKEKEINKTQKLVPVRAKNLNDYLFEQINSLNDEKKDLQKEIIKAKALTQISQQIINNANTCIKAVRTIKEFEITDNETLTMLGFKNV